MVLRRVVYQAIAFQTTSPQGDGNVIKKRRKKNENRKLSA